MIVAIGVNEGLTSMREAAGVPAGAGTSSSPGQQAMSRGCWQQACSPEGQACRAGCANAEPAAPVIRLTTTIRANSLDPTLRTVPSAEHGPCQTECRRFPVFSGAGPDGSPKFPQWTAGYYLAGWRA